MRTLATAPQKIIPNSSRNAAFSKGCESFIGDSRKFHSTAMVTPHNLGA
jgi:hypothetical protein